MERDVFKDKVLSFFKEVGRDTVEVGMVLVKITVPIIIITKIFEELGLIIYFSRLLEPVMEIMGLPGSLGLVWATGLLTTLYGAMAVFAALAPGLDLTTAQVTVLCSAMLIAHSLPIELSISRKAGAGAIPMGLLRLIGALVYAVILNWLCTVFNIWQEPAHIFFKGGGAEQSLFQWGISQISNIGLIFLVIFCILTGMKVLKAVGFLALLEWALKPVLPFFGMTQQAAPVTVLGMILGIGYGGALIIRETTKGTMSRKDVFNSLSLMALSHGLIEDTLLMVALGGKLGGILWGRLLFSLIVVFLMVKIQALLPSARVNNAA